MYLEDIISEAVAVGHIRHDLPSAFSMIFGCLPSMIATAELVVPWCFSEQANMRVFHKADIPRSIPITWPLTFSSPPLDCHLTKEEESGERVAGRREKVEDARGSYTTEMI